MSNVKILSIEIEGFGSFVKSTKVALDRGSIITLVKGENGSGKTTLFSALYWAFYGENLKGVKQQSLVTYKKHRPKEFLGTRVLVDFVIGEVPYKVARHIDYIGFTEGRVGDTSLMIFRDGKLFDHQSDKRTQTKFVSDLLGMDSKLFVNSIIFGQRVVRFLECKGEEKRRVLESIFDVGFVDELKQKAKKKYDELVALGIARSTKIERLDTEVNGLNAQLKSKEEELANHQADKARRLESIRERIKEEQARQAPHKAAQEKILKDGNEVRNRIKEYDSKDDAKFIEAFENSEASDVKRREDIDRLDGRIKTEKAALQVLQKERGDQKENICDYCGHPLEKASLEKVLSRFDAKIKTIDQEIASLEKVLSDLKVVDDPGEPNLEDNRILYEACLESVEKNKADQTKVEVLIAEYSGLDKLLQAGEASIKRAHDEIASEEASPAPKDNLKETNSKIEDREGQKLLLEREQIKAQRQEDIANWWVKKGFSPSGISSYIFESMLGLLNTSIEKYAPSLGVRVVFSIDLSMASKPFVTKCYSAGGLAVSYSDFSGGERSRIDIATAFALHDVMSKSSDFNLLVLDEVFEGLDEGGVEDVFRLIRAKAKDKSVYVITHAKHVNMYECKALSVAKVENNTILT